jgi:cytosine/adenosine deaminase-related metal-dependent hydrolase
VHLTDHDREIIAARGAYIAHNPVSNMKLCSGLFDFEAARAAGCRIAIGTDGTSSNNNLSMLDEMKCAALTAKVTSGKPTAGRNRDIFHAATVTGAEFAGINAGKIAVGKAADLLLVNMDSIALSAGYDLLADMVYAAGSEVIDYHNMNREEESTAKHQQITGANRKALFNAQQIKTGNGDRHTEPDNLWNLLFDKYTHQRHNHNIQSGNETSLACGGHTDTKLLQ